MCYFERDHCELETIVEYFLGCDWIAKDVELSSWSHISLTYGSTHNAHLL